MALDSHIDSLKRKHAQIDQKIHEELNHPGSDDMELHRLKAQKLELKDEIERLRHSQRIAA